MSFINQQFRPAFCFIQFNPKEFGLFGLSCSHFQESNPRILRKIQIPATKSDLLSRQAFDFNWHSFPYVLPSLPQTALNIKGQKFRHPSENIEKNHRHSSIYAVNVGTHKKPAERENCLNRGYLVVLKGRKIGQKYKPR